MASSGAAPDLSVLADRSVLVPPGSIDAARFERACRLIDGANADDPNTISVGGLSHPKELAHAALATAWVRHLDPEAGEEQLLAARAHHLRRWSLPRVEYPEGRGGYLRWRAELKKRQAAAVGELLGEAGYDAEVIARVRQLVRKEGLGHDPQVQTHEDALCLVFLQTQLDELSDQLGDDRIVEVVAKTVKKMSPAAVEAASALDLGARGREVLARAGDASS